MKTELNIDLNIDLKGMQKGVCFREGRRQPPQTLLLEEDMSASIYTTRAISAIRYATIHHSADVGVPADLAALRVRLAAHEEVHKRREYGKTKGEFGYKHLLYSFAVAGDGSWVQTQRLQYQLYHATDWYKGYESANQWGFGILLEGNFELEQPTREQLEAAAEIIYKFNIENGTRLIVKGHREFSAPRYATLCPGRHMGLSTDPASNLSWILRRVDAMHTKPKTLPIRGSWRERLRRLMPF